MIMSRDQNIVRNGNIQIGNLSFEEDVSKFRPRDGFRNAISISCNFIKAVVIYISSCLQMGKQKLWSKEDIIEAVKPVREKKMGYKLVSNRHQPTQVTERQETEPETSNSVISPEDIRKVPVIEPSFSNRRGTALLYECVEWLTSNTEQTYFVPCKEDLSYMCYRIHSKHSHQAKEHLKHSIMTSAISDSKSKCEYCDLKIYSASIEHAQNIDLSFQMINHVFLDVQFLQYGVILYLLKARQVQTAALMQFFCLAVNAQGSPSYVK
ncbi:hypothetical protein ANN_03118 [Periplaneta americana]|uniref:Uncharacterized protein n=1 Tax=Periplaneta americana TaxID=6978 RepID=A0ABQ8TY51_PERAM|nr:hypothetical protein ANN_03118 [Periplaneta americana]